MHAADSPSCMIRPFILPMISQHGPGGQAQHWANRAFPLPGVVGPHLQVDRTWEEEKTTAKYKIQVIATNSEAKADLTILDLKEYTSHPVFHEKIGELYKVFIGLFIDEAQARKVLQEIRAAGFSDAWLVY